MYIFAFFAIPIVVLLGVGATNAETPQPKIIALFDESMGKNFFIDILPGTTLTLTPCQLVSRTYGFVCNVEYDGAFSGILTIVEDANENVDAVCAELSDGDFEKIQWYCTEFGFTLKSDIEATITDGNNNPVKVYATLPNAIDGCSPDEKLYPTKVYVWRNYCAAKSAGFYDIAEKLKNIEYAPNDGKPLDACL